MLGEMSSWTVCRFSCLSLRLKNKRTQKNTTHCKTRELQEVIELLYEDKITSRNKAKNIMYCAGGGVVCPPRSLRSIWSLLYTFLVLSEGCVMTGCVRFGALDEKVFHGVWSLTVLEGFCVKHFGCKLGSVVVLLLYSSRPINPTNAAGNVPS